MSSPPNVGNHHRKRRVKNRPPAIQSPLGFPVAGATVIN